MMRKPKLLYVVTEDWYFRSHRLPLAVKALQSGFQVGLVSRFHQDPADLRQLGMHIYPFSILRRSMNPVRDMMVAFRLARLLKRARPDILHLVSLKPILLGNIAARIAGIPHRVSEVTGMGTLFSDDGAYSLVRRAIQYILGYFMRGSTIIVQNTDDYALWRQTVPRATDIVLVPGVGVDIRKFHPQPEPEGVPVVLLPARLLWYKGIGEFVQAARLLRTWGVSVRMVLVGPLDPENPAAISRTQIQTWVQEGLIEWWGYQRDMTQVYPKAHVVCLPTFYREGLPKVLLEAAASARPIVTTDVPGCREVVQHEFNGLLIPPRDPVALAQALRRLIESPSLRRQMGARNRRLAEQRFDHRRIARRFLEIYQELRA